MRDRYRLAIEREQTIERNLKHEQKARRRDNQRIQGEHNKSLSDVEHTVKLAVAPAFFPAQRLPRSFEATIRVHDVRWDRAEPLPMLTVYAELLASDDLGWPRK